MLLTAAVAGLSAGHAAMDQLPLKLDLVAVHYRGVCCKGGI